jgi:hypothetical protein
MSRRRPDICVSMCRKTHLLTMTSRYMRYVYTSRRRPDSCVSPCRISHLLTMTSRNVRYVYTSPCRISHLLTMTSRYVIYVYTSPCGISHLLTKTSRYVRLIGSHLVCFWDRISHQSYRYSISHERCDCVFLLSITWVIYPIPKAY